MKSTQPCTHLHVLVSSPLPAKPRSVISRGCASLQHSTDEGMSIICVASNTIPKPGHSHPRAVSVYSPNGIRRPESVASTQTPLPSDPTATPHVDSTILHNGMSIPCSHFRQPLQNSSHRRTCTHHFHTEEFPFAGSLMNRH